MISSRFCRLQLRTTDVEAARAFYEKVLGEVRADIVLLPPEVVARGARPHWLGHLGVDDVEAKVSAFVERGATRLGPTRPMVDGGQVAIIRDPGGAVVALATPPVVVKDSGVVWQILNTSNLAAVTSAYGELFGWHFTESLDFGQLGVFHQFAWDAGGSSVGAMTDITGRPSVHPHWLFHFRVDALAPALATVRAAGGLALDPVLLPTGERITVCDDPQGGAFALCEWND